MPVRSMLNARAAPFVLMLVLVLVACGTDSGSAEFGQSSEEHQESDGEESGEHDGGSSEEAEEGEDSAAEESSEESSEAEMNSEGNEGEEESGIQYATDEGYDETRNGARLTLSYDAATNTFTGTVENLTSETLTRIRVEVHLSNGTELGSTTPTDLPSGQTLTITLKATEEPFDTYSAHPEVGNEEGGYESEEGEGGEQGEGAGEGEHDEEGDG